MQTKRRLLLIAMVGLLLGISGAQAAESTDFYTVVGIVDTSEKETLKITTGEKPKKIVELKITGTSNFYLLAPQVRAGKTVVTQRSVAASDLSAGQHVAVIYTTVDKEHVLLTAIVKALEKN